MGELSRTLQNNEAELWCGSEDAAGPPFPQEPLEVVVRLKAEQREAEPILTTRLAVTGSTIASVSGEEGNDLVLEADRYDLGMSFYRDGARCARAAFPGRSDGRCPVPEGAHEPSAIHGHNACRITGVVSLAGDIPRGCHQDELMALVGAVQRNGLAIAPAYLILGAGRAEGETAAEEKAQCTGSDSRANQNSGRGLPSQMMKGRPS